MKTNKILLIILSMVTVYATGYFYIGTIKFIENSTQTSGNIVEMVRKNGTNNTLYPIFQFTDATGTKQKIKSNIGSNPPSYHVGEKVKIYYDSKNPTDAKINGFFSLWSGSIIFGSITFIILLLIIFGNYPSTMKKSTVINKKIIRKD